MLMLTMEPANKPAPKPSEALEWVWETRDASVNVRFKCDNKEILYHPSYSSGTAAVKGNQPLTAGRNYFWEIEMISPLYGTDVMVGVGTDKVNLKRNEYEFSSLLGENGESWGFSYRGILQHKGIMKKYGSGYGQGNIIGVHLDMNLGLLTFYVNRRPLGVAFSKMKDHVLYPMACSTAARSAMRIIAAYSYIPTLQFRCLVALGKKSGRSKQDLFKKLECIPGLREQVNKACWLFPIPEEMTEGEEMDDFYYEAEDKHGQPIPAIEGAEPATNPSLVRLRDVNYMANQYREYYIEIYLENNMYTSLDPS